MEKNIRLKVSYKWFLKPGPYCKTFEVFLLCSLYTNHSIFFRYTGIYPYGPHHHYKHLAHHHHHVYKKPCTRKVCKTTSHLQCKFRLKTVCRTYCNYKKSYEYDYYGGGHGYKHCKHVCHKQPARDCYPKPITICHYMACKHY